MIWKHMRQHTYLGPTGIRQWMGPADSPSCNIRFMQQAHECMQWKVRMFRRQVTTIRIEPP